MKSGVYNQKVKDDVEARRNSISEMSDKKKKVAELQDQLFNIGAF
ncbi:MAG: hypothetical protein Q4C49_00115 [Bacillota bacterium]|nr:hypothetical protein [Bacillota bacterium]